MFLSTQHHTLRYNDQSRGYMKSCIYSVLNTVDYSLRHTTFHRILFVKQIITCLYFEFKKKSLTLRYKKMCKKIYTYFAEFSCPSKLTWHTSSIMYMTCVFTTVARTWVRTVTPIHAMPNTTFKIRYISVMWNVFVMLFWNIYRLLIENNNVYKWTTRIILSKWFV